MESSDKVLVTYRWNEWISGYVRKINPMPGKFQGLVDMSLQQVVY